MPPPPSAAAPPSAPAPPASGGEPQRSVIAKAYWMSDKNAKQCYDCGAPFSAFRRKHHCRLCGQIFCGSCSASKIPGRLYGQKGALRVCNHCFGLAQKEAALRQNRTMTPVRQAAAFDAHDPDAMAAVPRSLGAEMDGAGDGPEGGGGEGGGGSTKEEEDEEVEEEDEGEEDPTVAGVGIMDEEAAGAPAASPDEGGRERLVRVADVHLDHFVRRVVEAHALPARDWVPTLLRLSRRAVGTLRQTVRNGDDLSVQDYVQVKTVAGGTLAQCEYVEGVLSRRTVCHKRMPMRVERPRVLLLSCALEFERSDGKLSFLDTMVAQEREYVEMLVRKIASLEPSVVMVERSVSGRARQLLLERGIAVVANVKLRLLRRVARATGAYILPAPDYVDKSVMSSDVILGTCALFRVRALRDRPDATGPGSVNEHPTHAVNYRRGTLMMSFEGCQPDRHACVVLRGRSLPVLRRAKAALRHCVLAAYHLSLETALFRDLCGTYPPAVCAKQARDPAAALAYRGQMASSTPLAEFRRRQDSSAPLLTLREHMETGFGMSPSASDQSVGGAAGSSLAAASRKAADEAAAGAPAASAYVPLQLRLPRHRHMGIMFAPVPLSPMVPVAARPAWQTLKVGGLLEAAKAAVAAASGLAAEHASEAAADEAERNLGSPAREAAAARQANGLGGGSTSTSLSTSSSSSSTSSSSTSTTTTAGGGGGKKRSRVTGAEPYAPLLPWTSDGLVLGVCWLSDTWQCFPPQIRRAPFYTEADVSLGQFISDHCFNLDALCVSRKCKRNVLRHVLTYTHGLGRIEAVVKRIKRLVPRPVMVSGRPVPPPAPGAPDTVPRGSTGITMWSVCKRCRCKATPYVGLSERAYNMSFGKFLEVSFYNDRLRSQFGACQHLVHRDHVRFFGKGRFVVSFEYQELLPFDLSVEGRMTHDPADLERAKARLTDDLHAVSSDFLELFAVRLAALRASLAADAEPPAADEADEAADNGERSEHGVVVSQPPVAAAPAADAAAADASAKEAAAAATPAADEPVSPGGPRPPPLPPAAVRAPGLRTQGTDIVRTLARSLLHRVDHLASQVAAEVDEVRETLETAAGERPPAAMFRLNALKNQLSGLFHTWNSQVLTVWRDRMTYARQVQRRDARRAGAASVAASPDRRGGGSSGDAEAGDAAAHLARPMRELLPGRPLLAQAGLDVPEGAAGRVVRVLLDASVGTGHISIQCSPDLLCRDACEAAVQKLVRHGSATEEEAASGASSFVLRLRIGTSDVYVCRTAAAAAAAAAKAPPGTPRGGPPAAPPARGLAPAGGDAGGEPAGASPVVRTADVGRGADWLDPYGSSTCHVHLPQLVGGLVVSVYDDEPSSMVAYFLLTPQHMRFVRPDLFGQRGGRLGDAGGDAAAATAAAASAAAAAAAAAAGGDAPVPRLRLDLQDAKAKAAHDSASDVNSSAKNLRAEAFERSPHASPRMGHGDEEGQKEVAESEHGEEEDDDDDDGDDGSFRDFDDDLDDAAEAMADLAASEDSGGAHGGWSSPYLARMADRRAIEAELQGRAARPDQEHVTALFADVRPGPTPAHGQEGAAQSTFSVTAFFARQFYALRQAYCDGDEQYLQSLSRSLKWDANGGKSGSTFSKTTDGRYLLKYIKKTDEVLMFLDTAYEYFEYMAGHLFHNVPTCLVKILGVYEVVWRPRGESEQRKHVLVMPNVFYKRNISQTFDLKGSVRNRRVDGSQSVQLDVNLMEFTKGMPVPMKDKAKELLRMAVWNDTLYLARIKVVDYSMLVGISEDERQLVVGIIDYVHQYNWDKKAEKFIKNIIHGGSSVPHTEILASTIQSPEDYKRRFRIAMDRYFMAAPDQACESNFALRTDRSVVSMLTRAS